MDPRNWVDQLYRVGRPVSVGPFCTLGRVNSSKLLPLRPRNLHLIEQNVRFHLPVVIDFTQSRNRLA
jgi:hypothetical protein